MRRHTMTRLRSVLAWVRGERDAEWYRRRGADIGDGVYIGRSSSLDTGFLHLISVGANTTISARVEVLAHDAGMNRSTGYTLVAPTVIGDDVYIGAGAIVLPGVTIGDRSVIGAGSVVTRDVPPDTVVAGNPARAMRSVDELAIKHRAALDSRPRYPARGWNAAAGPVPVENRARMRRDLADGPGYIE